VNMAEAMVALPRTGGFNLELSSRKANLEKSGIVLPMPRFRKRTTTNAALVWKVRENMNESKLMLEPG
jgi:hypothetical protein